MVVYMRKYFTKSYDVDGPIFLKTPLELCASLHANLAEEIIRKHLDELTHGNIGSRTVISHTVGEVNKDRAAEAKRKLREFQAKR
jgi:hypothetical protein